ncbi:hypothetical protein SAMN02983003_2459 [Devosia enhydra]|uniref:Cysteine rich repeat-containing protein n=1 Tax=Devosia enhydra TaxID=665118 RepID=A0A1K2HZE5_9HYPH|nr:hypothetical protein [Devosia enhydra]SFZ85232.1 hypothetical protein SAMN02983003_2459 [Devosia enhydra]
MTTTIRIAAFALFTLVSYGSAQAAAGDLAKCYDRVISSCNKTNHAQSCAENGMNQCDEVHPTPYVFQPQLNLRAGLGR